MARKSRRDFVKQCVAAVGGASLARPSGSLTMQAAAEPPLTNWAGNYTYSVSTVAKAAARSQVQDFIRQHDHLRVLGTRHCFNSLADSTAYLLSVRDMHAVVSLDKTAKTVTVEAGMSYGQLCPWLHEQGFALHNLASLPHISIAGACATATHGSGVTNGNLATAVSALEIVTANGGLLHVSRAKDPAVFNGCVVHLGALGALTQVTLNVQPTFDVRQDVYLDLPMSAVRDHFEAIVSAGYSVSLFTDWQKGRVNEVWVKRRLEPGQPVTVDREFYGAKAATTNVHPIVELSAENCTAQMGVPGPWYDRLPHFRMGFTPSSGKELQSEYFVPRAKAVEAIQAVERLRDHVSPHLMITELRTIDADELWMSTCYQRPSLAIHFTWKPEWDAVRQVLPMIERELAPFDVRPHWGKLFTIPPKTLQGRYPKCEDFKRLVAEHDPQGKFRNAFLATNLYG
jgi:alditol oxidase